MRYEEYLKSDEWKHLRANARYRAKNRCEHCGGSPDHVHHVRYPKNFKDDTLENLIVVCGSCHMKHHGIRGKEMTNALSIEFAGDQFCATEFEGKHFARFEDVRRILNFLSSHWATCQREIEEGTDWLLLENPFTGKIEPFLSESGVLILGMRFGMNDKAKQLRRTLADMATNKTPIAKPMTPGEILRLQAEQMIYLERIAEEAKADSAAAKAIAETTQSQVDGIRNLVIRVIAPDGTYQARTYINTFIPGVCPDEIVFGQTTLVQLIGKHASIIAKQRGYSIKKVSEGRYMVGTYTKEILDDAVYSARSEYNQRNRNS
jgi:hypothetical protein